MTFDDIIGQEAVKAKLRDALIRDKVPHALMLYGPRGGGKLPLAVAYAQMLLCEHPREDGSACGECLSCRMAAKLEHPDLHFTFPIIKPEKEKTENATTDNFIAEWREQLLSNPYFDINDWLVDMGATTQQAQYYVAECDYILNRLMLKSSQGGRKVMVVWLPEKMKSDTANRLLKLLEEPPAKTHFIMACEEPDVVLSTILSRTQRVQVPHLSNAEIQAKLERQGVVDDALNLARLAHGSMTMALRVCRDQGDEVQFLEYFMMMMRNAYQVKLDELREWSETMAQIGRENQKRFLQYAQRLVRENFVYNFGQPELNYMTTREAEFSTRFARFVNEQSVIPVMDLLGEAERDIGRNVNAKMVFFDVAVKMTAIMGQTRTYLANQKNP